MVTLLKTENANMKKNVPKIRFKGCQGEWESSTFIGTFQFLKNNSLSRACLSDNGDVKNVHYGDVLIRFGENLDVGKVALPYISDGSYGRVLAKRCSLQDGDVIIADAAEDNTVGKATELMSVGNNTVVSGLHTITCRPTFTFESCYLGYYLNSNAYHNQLLPLIQGTKICSISKHALEKTTVSYPPTLAEQRQIAAYFRSLDGILSGCESRLSSLRRLKEGALQAFFPQQGETQPRIRFKGCKGEWERLPLSSIVTRVSDTGSSQSLPYVEFEDIVSGEGILNKDIKDKKGIKIGNKFVAGDVLFGKLRPYLKNILLTNFTGVAVGDFWVLRPSGILPEILYLLVSSNAFMEVANISSGSKMPRSDWKLVSNSQFNIPPTLTEQRLIANFFRTLDRRIELERQRFEKLKQLKAACLEKMFV